MKSKYYGVLTIGLIVLLAFGAAGCYRKTPEQRAERVVRHLVSTLSLDAAQAAKLEKMKEEFLAQRPELQKLRAESMADFKELMLGPEIDQSRLNGRREKVQAHTGDMLQFLFTKFMELHDMLTPEQRGKLVAMMEKHAERHHH